MTEPNEPNDGRQQDPTPPPSAERTLTQSKVDDIVRGRVAETARQTEERISQELGVDLAEAKEIIEASRAQAEREMTEAQKEKLAAEKAKAEAETAKADAARERRVAARERALVRAGIADAKLDRALRVMDLDDDADQDAVNAAVEQLKSDEPSWFGQSGLPQSGPSDTNGKPPKRKAGDSAYERGMQRAKAMAQPEGYKLLG